MTTHTGPPGEPYVPPGDDRDFFAALVERSKEAVAADTAVLLLLDQAAGHLDAAAADGLEEEVRQGVRIAVGAGFAGRIAATRQPVILGHVDHTTVANPLLVAAGIKTVMGVPLVADGAVIGVLHTGSLTPREFARPDAELLAAIADQTARTVLSYASHRINLRAVARQASRQSGLHAVPAGLHSSVRFAWCPHGHWYSPGSFTVSWERCPCYPAAATGQGHYLVTCHRCAAERRPTQINLPKCWYLGF